MDFVSGNEEKKTKIRFEFTCTKKNYKIRSYRLEKINNIKCGSSTKLSRYFYQCRPKPNLIIFNNKNP